MTHEREPGVEDWDALPDARDFPAGPLAGDDLAVGADDLAVEVDEMGAAVGPGKPLPDDDPSLPGDGARRRIQPQRRAAGARVIIQRGHCFRKSGATGTAGEQVFVEAVGQRAKALLEARGHQVSLVLADDKVPAGDVFFALHCDGSVHATAGGASVGYRNDAGRDLGARWKAAYQRLGWRHGFRRDNYTDNLSVYYGTGWAAKAGIRRAVVVEHGFLTNPTERAFLTSPRGHALAAETLVDVVGQLFGHPRTGGGPVIPDPSVDEDASTEPTAPDEEDWFAMATKDELRALIDERIRHFGLHEANAHARQARDAANAQGEKVRETVREEAAKTARDAVQGVRFHGDRTLAQHVVDLRKLSGEARGEARTVRRLVEQIAAAQGVDVGQLARQIADQLDVNVPQGASVDDVLDRLAERLAGSQ